MAEVRFVGLDLAKNVFQVHGADSAGRPLVRKQLRRAEVLRFFANLPRCSIGMEACASAHHWARQLSGLGHECKLIPARYVKAYLKTNKSDARDAEAICEAVQRPTMHFVAVKSVDQQAVLMLHRSRELLVAQRTQLGNSIRSQLAEFGVSLPVGAHLLAQKASAATADYSDERLPLLVRSTTELLLTQLRTLQEQIAELERRIEHWHHASDASRRLAQIPGIGPVTASALVASVGNASAFRSASHFAAWLGLVPRQSSTGGKTRLGSISKRGDGYLRRLLVHGAQAVLHWHRARASHQSNAWLAGLLGRRPVNIAAIALAHKNARIVWALLARGRDFAGYRGGTAALAG